MTFYMTFKFGSVFRNNFVKLNVDSLEDARLIAARDFADSWCMVYTESQWYDYMGVSQEKRFNLKELHHGGGT